MGNDAKYVIFEDFAAGPTAVVFPNWMDHNWFKDLWPTAEIISAGFVSFDADGGVQCYGKSHTLGVESRLDDVKIVRRQILGESPDWE